MRFPDAVADANFVPRMSGAVDSQTRRCRGDAVALVRLRVAGW